jgi:hypothetical protein
MKKIYNLFLPAAALVLSLTGCSNQDPFITAGPDDTPRFLAPSSIEGNVQTSVSQSREEAFNMEVVVTPAKYTTIEWIADGHVLGTGPTFDSYFEAGNYELMIKATTQVGKEAYRIVKLSVSALADDPSFNNKEKNRWLNPGQPLTIEGKNLNGVSSLIFTPVIEEETLLADEPTEVSCVASEDGNSVVVTLPEEMATGSYRVSAVNSETERFGLGLVTVSNEKYVDPDVEQKFLWEGSQVINWGDSNIRITADDLADVPVGTTLYINYTVPEAEYHALRITTDWWDYEIVPQFDITGETPNPFGFEYTAEVQQKIQEEGAMLIVGFGYEIQGIYYEALSPNAETVLWEDDPVVINWGDSNVHLTADQLASVQPGATIRVYFESVDAEYHAMRITSNSWGFDYVTQFDITGETPSPLEFTYTAEHQQKALEQEGMLVVGFGYKLLKVSFVN